jgi:hypothetical protein
LATSGATPGRLGIPALPLTPPVTVRLLTSDATTCSEATYSLRELDKRLRDVTEERDI